MPRSTYVYAVLTDRLVPIAAFTVKHELIVARDLGMLIAAAKWVARIRDGEVISRIDFERLEDFA